jgi:hypothetical protein
MTEINNHLQNNCDHSHEHIHSDASENPAVFSSSIPVEFEKGITGKELTSRLIKLFNSLKQWSTENHYLIGHIKSYVEDGNNFKLWIATTGREINIKNLNEKNEIIKNITINITAIIFGPDANSLRKIILDNLQGNLQVCNIS